MPAKASPGAKGKDKDRAPPFATAPTDWTRFVPSLLCVPERGTGGIWAADPPETVVG